MESGKKWLNNTYYSGVAFFTVAAALYLPYLDQKSANSSYKNAINFCEKNNVNISNVILLDDSGENVALNKTADGKYEKIDNVDIVTKNDIESIKSALSRGQTKGGISASRKISDGVLGGMLSSYFSAIFGALLGIRRFKRLKNTAFKNANKTARINNETYDIHLCVEEEYKGKVKKHDAVFETKKELSDGQFAEFLKGFEPLKQKGKYTILDNSTINELVYGEEIAPDSKEVIRKSKFGI